MTFFAWLDLSARLSARQRALGRCVFVCFLDFFVLFYALLTLSPLCSHSLRCREISAALLWHSSLLLDCPPRFPRVRALGGVLARMSRTCIPSSLRTVSCLFPSFSSHRFACMNRTPHFATNEPGSGCVFICVCLCVSLCVRDTRAWVASTNESDTNYCMVIVSCWPNIAVNKKTMPKNKCVHHD